MGSVHLEAHPVLRSGPDLRRRGNQGQRWRRALHRAVHLRFHLGVPGVRTQESRNARAEEISAAAAAWDRAGNSVFMVTLTVPHYVGMKLGKLMVAIAAAFRFMISGRPWRTLKSSVGIVGTIRAMEVTHGVNGWHPHLHVLVFIEGDPGARGLADMGIYFTSKWKQAVVREGLGAPHDHHGVKVERCHSAAEAGAYISKTDSGVSAGNEMTRGDLKTPHAGHRTPFGILEDFRQTGDAADLALWHGYERATKGQRKITWSRGTSQAAR